MRTDARFEGLTLQLADHTEEASGTHAQFNCPHGSSEIWYYDPPGRDGQGAGE